MEHFHFEELESTQDKAWELVKTGTQVPFFVTASLQTKGRGRQARQWHFEAGRSLAFSLAIHHPSNRLSGLSLAVGLGIHSALDIPNLRLKWPNDLMLENQKVGGILIEAATQRDASEVVIGVGINLIDQAHAQYRGIDRAEGLDAKNLVDQILKFVSVLANENFSPLQDSFNHILWKKGQLARMKWQNEEKEVRILSVDAQGALCLEEGGRLVLTVDGEILHEEQ